MPQTLQQESLIIMIMNFVQCLILPVILHIIGGTGRFSWKLGLNFDSSLKKIVLSLINC